MSKSWLEWTHENLERNCDPEGIVRVLLDNNFEVPAIREMMGERFPERASAAPIRIDMEGFQRKREAIVAMRRSLAKLHQGSWQVERRQGLSGAEFLDEYYSANRPVILTGLMANWKACTRWTPGYLKATCGQEVVEIMAARENNPLYEVDDAPHRKNVPFSEFVDLVTSASETNDYYLTARNNFFGRPAMRPLLDDIEPFDDYIRVDDSGNGMFFWYGPKGTITPLHHDLMNIFMAQVRGSKQIRLIPPEDLDLVYNYHAVYSLVDAGNPDYSRFPKFRDATVYDLELAPGEVLFLPVGLVALRQGSQYQHHRHLQQLSLPEPVLLGAPRSWPLRVVDSRF